MLNIQVPHKKLRLFQGRLGISDDDLKALEPFQVLFINKKKKFADYFYKTFLEIPETRVILELQERPDFLLNVWAHWFETFFKGKLDDDFFAYLWRIGLRHVEVNLDQRFSNLGFSIIRQFCHEIVQSEIPSDKMVTVSRVIDKLLDLCLLVETSAYIEATIRCDAEVIKGLADRVRNPITVIGGSLKRLQRKIDFDNPAYSIYESLISENERLEDMVMDVKKYFETFQEEPEPRILSLEELIKNALQRLQAEIRFENIPIDINIAADASHVKGDPRDLEYTFYYLLQNSLEAVDTKNPYIRISSSLENAPPHSINIEVFNSGTPPKAEDIEKLFSPFYSTKSTGTGFGLPIARLAVRKNNGRLSIRPVPGEGTRVIITLPRPEY